MEKTRVDKWLWSIRLFKTRTAAKKACDKGLVRIDGDIAKASSNVVVGNRVKARVHHVYREVEVVKLIDKRVGAAIAKECYVDHTPEEELKKGHKLRSVFYPQGYRERGTGRPTKKERRDIEAWRYHDEDDQ